MITTTQLPGNQHTNDSRVRPKEHPWNRKELSIKEMSDGRSTVKDDETVAIGEILDYFCR